MPAMFEDLKPRPNHEHYIEVLRRMTPQQRLKKCFELSDLTKRLLWRAIRRANPDLSDAEVHEKYLRQLDKCHNRSF